MKQIPLVTMGVALEACYLSVRWAESSATGLLVGLLIAANLFYIVAHWASQDPARAISWRWIAAFALLHRATVWTAPPVLSDDCNRYLFEARVDAAGGNPYLVRPNDAEWKHLLPPDPVPAPDFRAGYGPLWELTQGAWLRIAPASGASWMKGPAVLADLALLALLVRQPHGLLYAWSPAAVAEFAWNGHNDAVVMLAVMLALRWRSFGALGVAVALKWWPVVLIPALMRQASWRGLAWIPAIVAAAALPYWPRDPAALVENARFMSGFVGGWRNNDSLFGALLWMAGGDLVAAKYLAFGAIAAGALWFARWPLERAWLATVAAVLLLAANSHPWYLTWITPLLVFTPWTPALLWCGLAPLAYRVLVEWRILGEWNGSRSDRWFIYVPVFASFVWSWAVMNRARFRQTP